MSYFLFGSVKFIQNRRIIVIVTYNLFYNVAFKFFIRLIQVVCVHSIDHVMYCSLLMFGRVT